MSHSSNDFHDGVAVNILYKEVENTIWTTLKIGDGHHILDVTVFGSDNRDQFLKDLKAAVDKIVVGEEFKLVEVDDE